MADRPHQAVCDPQTGTVSQIPKPVDDGNPCTNDFCNPQTGAILHTPLTKAQLDDGNPCTVDQCTKKEGITHKPAPVGSSCNDGDSCTSNDYCNEQAECVGGTKELTSACGFHAHSPPSNPLGPPLPQGTSEEVGTIDGTFSVSASGAAVYSVPFLLPPGRAGLTPEIGLQYSSDSGNGHAGVGFSLTGRSVIHRCAANLAVHGYVKAVDYIHDEICLDGLPLRVVETSSNGGSFLEFRTFPDTFAKIIAHTSPGDSKNYTWFEVYEKSGKILYYGWDGQGQELGARPPLAPLAGQPRYQQWNLYRSSDRYGNSIHYTYENRLSSPDQVEESYLSRISYPPGNHVTFHYEERPDKRFSFSGGVRFALTQRLVRVDIQSETTPVRSYWLRYDDPQGVAGDPSWGSRRSRLRSLQECVMEGSQQKCKPDTTFGWYQGSPGFSEAETIGPGPSSPYGVLFPVDLDRDGLDDLVYTNTTKLTTCIEDIHKGKHFCGADVDCSQGGCSDCSPCLPGTQCLQGACADTCLSDADCVYPLQCLPVYPQTIGEKTYFHCVPPNGVSFQDLEFSWQDLVLWKSSGFNPQLNQYSTSINTLNLDRVPLFLPLDSNGDKNTDLLVSNLEVQGKYGVVLGPDFSTIKNTNINKPPELVANTALRGASHLADLNGDGFADLVQCWPPSSTRSQNSYWTYQLHSGSKSSIADYKAPEIIGGLNGVSCRNRTLILDLNGDGVSEFLIYPNGEGNLWRFRLNVESPPQGESGYTQDLSQTNLSFASTLQPVLADVNGDGLRDVVTTSHDSFLIVWLNRGDGTFEPPGPVVTPSGSSSQLAPTLLQMGVVVDYNGDGLDDILIPNLEVLSDLRWDVLLSWGNGFDRISTSMRFEGRAPNANSEPEIRQLVLEGKIETKYQNYRAMDVNGDGLPDLVGVSREGALLQRKSNLYEEDILRSIDDGLRYSDPETSMDHQPTLSIVYDHLFSRNDFYNFYQKASPEVCANLGSVDCYAGSKRVVHSYKVNNGHLFKNKYDRVNEYRYFYRDARFDRQARQWLGFSQRTIHQGTPEGTTLEPIHIREEYYDLDSVHHGIHFLAGKPIRIVTATKSKNSTHTYTEESFKYKTKESQNAPTFFVYTEEHTALAGDAPQTSPFSSDIKELKPTLHKISKDIVHDIDGFGNVIRRTTSSHPLQTEQLLYYLNNTEDWIIGRPYFSRTCETSYSLNISNGCGISIVEYDDRGYPQVVIRDPLDPEQWLRSTVFRDFWGNVIGVVSQDQRAGQRSSWTVFDEQGWYPSVHINELGHLTFEQYDRALGVLVQVQDPNGSVWKAAYDGFGRLTRTQNPDGVETSISRKRFLDPSQNVWLTRVHASSSQGFQSTQILNNLGQPFLVSQLGFGGNYFYKAYAYDPLGGYAERVTLNKKTTEPLQDLSLYSDALSATATNRVSFDYAGRPTRTEDPDGVKTHFLYDPQGKSYLLTPKGHSYTKTYDYSGDLLAVTDPNGENIFYDHGAFGSVRIRAPGDKASGTLLQRDWRGRLIYRNDPNRGEAIYQYNAFGDLISEKHQNVYEIKYTHDTLGRPVQKKVLDIPTNTEEITTWTWDTAPHGLGRLATAQTNEGHSESYEYDSLGHLVRTKTKPSIPGESRGIPTTYTTTYEYQAGRLYAIRYPATPTEPPLSVYYHYSEEGILSSIYAQSSLLGRSSLIWRLEEVDEQGRMKLEQTGNGLRNEYGFDPLNGLLTQLKTFQSDGTTLQHFSYAYDKNRNLSFQSNLIQNQSESFLHDALDRLSRSTIQSTTGTNDTTDFEYFSNGNIKRIKKPSKFSFFGGAVWKYDPAHPHAVREAIRDNQTYTFEYDLLGRQIRRSSSMIPGDSRYLGYTSFDKPRWISPTLDPNDPKAVRFSYDAHQQRILKDSSSEQTLYIQGIYEKKIDKTTNQITLRRHITNGSRVIATLTAIRTPQQQEWLSQIHYLHTDRLGSPTLISDAEGKVEEYRSYDAFGRRRDPKDWRLSNSSPPSLLTSGFTGHEEDDELGLINMKGRIYDPTIARFLSPDPVVAVPQFSQSWNRYSYVFNAPLSFVDPSGFNPVPTEEELFRYEVAQEALKNGCPSGLECSGHQKTVEEFEKNYPQPSPVAAPNSPATTPNSNDSFGSSASPIDHYTNDLQELEQAGSAVLGLTFGILQGAIPFAGFVPSNNADNAAYESARAVGNIIGGAISIAYGLGATATGGGAGPGLMVAGKGGAALLSGYRALSMAGAVAVAGSGTGAVAGALSGARNALHNGKPQPLLMAGSNKASVIGDSGSSGPSDTRIGVLEISPKGSRIALGSYNTSKDHKGLRDKVLGKPNDLDTKQLGLILDQEKIHIVTPHSSTGFTTSSQDIPLIETALRQADLIHPNGTIVLISGQKPFIIRP